MNKRHEICFMIIAFAGGAGFGYMISPLLSRVAPLFSSSFCSVVFVAFTFWLLHDIQSQIKVRDQERADILKQRRRKQSVVLSRHPLYESPEDTFGIKNMDQLDYYFDRNWEDVDQLDYDKDGHYIFKDHKYFLG